MSAVEGSALRSRSGSGASDRARACRLSSIPGSHGARGLAERSSGWRPADDPEQISLRLLPSGPDRVGEASAHRRSPSPISRGAGAGASASRARYSASPMTLNAFTNTFAGNPLDRASYRRADEAWIAEQLANPAVAGHRPVERQASGGDREGRRRADRLSGGGHGPGAARPGPSGCCSWACGRIPPSSPWTSRGTPIPPTGRWKAWDASRTCGPSP